MQPGGKYKLNIEQTSEYNAKLLPDIMVDNDIDIVFISSFVPEIFSYTIYKAMFMGLTVVGFDNAAHTERIKKYKYKFAEIADAVSPKSLLKALYILIEKITIHKYNNKNNRYNTNNKVIYTCITGGYDDIPVHKYVAPDWDYFLFTDDTDLIAKGKFEHWIVKPLVFDKLDNVRKNRWHKINAHKLFSQYDYSLYVDGNIIINNENPFKLFDELIKQNVLFAVPNHPERKCIYDEAAIVKQIQIDYPDVIDAEMDFLRSERYPVNNGLSENNILLRKHNAIKKSMDLWWKMIKKYSKRDQLSLRYVLWKTKVPVTPIYTDENGFGIHRQNEDFTFIFKKTHNQDKINNNEQRIETIPTRVLPKWFCRLVCGFIPVQNIRHKFKDKFMRR